MDGIANFLARHIDSDFRWQFVSFANQFKFVTHDVENAAFLEAGARFFIDEGNRHVNVDLSAFREPQKVDMRRTVGNRMQRNILWQGAHFFASKLNLDD